MGVFCQRCHCVAVINYLWQMLCCLVALGFYQLAWFLLGLVASKMEN